MERHAGEDTKTPVFPSYPNVQTLSRAPEASDKEASQWTIHKHNQLQLKLWPKVWPRYDLLAAAHENKFASLLLQCKHFYSSVINTILFQNILSHAKN